MICDLYARIGLALGIRGTLAACGYTAAVQGAWNGDHDKIPAWREPTKTHDLLLAVHWPRLFPDSFLARYPHALNLHPNLSLGYKVENPVGRALEAGHTLMSVACHHMSAEADSGEILAEHWRSIPAGATVEYAYDLLRPLYGSALKEALGKL